MWLFHMWHAGLSEDIRRVCRRFGIRMVFWLSMTLWNQLTRVKERRLNLVYSCGKVYISETIRRLETRMKEHQNTCKRGRWRDLHIAEHAWSEHHQRGQP